MRFAVLAMLGLAACGPKERLHVNDETPGAFQGIQIGADKDGVPLLAVIDTRTGNVTGCKILTPPASPVCANRTGSAEPAASLPPASMIPEGYSRKFKNKAGEVHTFQNVGGKVTEVD
jgi:hypothetical protein